jgi:hypothetical protein
VTNLSPAAQAVLDAFGKYPLHGDHIAENLMHGALPAALRAAVAHTQLYQGNDCLGNEVWTCDADELLAIATKLEGNA